MSNILLAVRWGAWNHIGVWGCGAQQFHYCLRSVYTIRCLSQEASFEPYSRLHEHKRVS